jgi:hypothetical protein
MDNKPIENVDIIGEEEAERIASELKANSQAYEGEEIVNTLDKDYPTSIEDAVEQIEKLQCRIEGLEEVIRHNKNSYLKSIDSLSNKNKGMIEFLIKHYEE